MALTSHHTHAQSGCSYPRARTGSASEKPSTAGQYFYIAEFRAQPSELVLDIHGQNRVSGWASADNLVTLLFRHCLLTPSTNSLHPVSKLVASSIPARCSELPLRDEMVGGISRDVHLSTEHAVSRLPTRRASSSRGGSPHLLEGPSPRSIGLSSTFCHCLLCLVQQQDNYYKAASTLSGTRPRWHSSTATAGHNPHRVPPLIAGEIIQQMPPCR